MTDPRTIVGILTVIAFVGVLIYVMALAVEGEDLAATQYEVQAEKRTFDEYAKQRALRLVNSDKRDWKGRKL